MAFRYDINSPEDFEHELAFKKNKVNNLGVITQETVAIANYAIKYDRDRYLDKLEKTQGETKEKYEQMAYIFEGLSDFYDALLKGYLLNSDEDELFEFWKKLFALKSIHFMANKKRDALNVYGWQIGVIGLMNNILYYDLEVNPLSINQALIKIKKQYDEFEKEKGIDIMREVMNNHSYKDKELRECVALEKAKSKTVEEALSTKDKSKKYYEYMNDVPMAGTTDETGKYHKGIEDYIPHSQYDDEKQGKKHRNSVIADIKENWITLSRNGKFHAIFATSSIPEAIMYYRLFKSEMPDLKVTALFDKNIDNDGKAIFKEDGLVEILEDYNNRYSQKYSIPTYGDFKKDVSLRLAHKKHYSGIENSPEKQLDLLIVVDQMLTGFDSKWVNTLYLDKLLEYEHLVQAFSRTNRLFDKSEKPFGIVRYYRYPHTMERNIKEAFRAYSGDKPYGIFAQKLEQNLLQMNKDFRDIDDLFKLAGIENFERNPDSDDERREFIKLFHSLNAHLQAAIIQDFTWKKLEYKFKHGKKDNVKVTVLLAFDENIYLTLLIRYKELFKPVEVGENPPYDIDSHLIEKDTERIDKNYMNSNFKKFLKALQDGNYL